MAERHHRCPVCGIERTEQRVIQHLQVSHRKSTLCRLLLQGRETDDDGDPVEPTPGTGQPESTDRDVESNEDDSTEVPNDATPKPA